MAYTSPDPLSANWSYDGAIDLFSLNTMVPESFPMDIPNDMLWDTKDLPADFFAAPTDINGFTVSHDDSLSSVCSCHPMPSPPSLIAHTNPLNQDESDDQSFSPTNFMSSTPPSAIDLPSPIQTIHPSQTQAQLPKRKASSISTSSTRYSSSPELLPQQPQQLQQTTTTTTSSSTRKPRSSAANRGEDTVRGRNAAKRAAHNIIEKRYRTNMNAKFVALDKAMAVKPAGVSKSATTTTTSTSASNGVKSSASLKKSEILSNAITYMQELQDANERLRKEVLALSRDRERRYC